ncbi:MAG: transketolase [Bdellovibrionaceae bacterium]|nr:transketolase [Pseudobdellovibrionaceae bacterium]|tara:strand:+ start:37222 stop:39237 length:2016 start_codon:yes stop_codon:yes gene_type:complete
MKLQPSFGRLAKNPKSCAIYNQELKLKSGETIQLSDPDVNRAFVACMDMSAVLGGAASHYGGPAAFAEINSVIYGYAFHKAKQDKKEWSELFHFVNDAGHCENGIYAIKANYNFAELDFEALKKFRSMESPLTGHGEAHMFPQGVLISNGPLGSGVAQAQGLAAADAFADNKNRVTVLSLSDGGAMEGEAKEALTSIPGLAQRNKLAPFICIISDNNTKLSGRIDQDSFSMQGYFASLEQQGWDYRVVEKGNDLESVLAAYEKAVDDALANPTKPILLLTKTVKGIGTKKTAESASGAHGFPLKSADDLRPFVEEILNGKEMPSEISHWIDDLENASTGSSSSSAPAVKKEKIQVGVANALIKARKEGLPVVSISSDLAGSTGVASFQKEFPEATLDIGIAESNMVSLGCGFSLTGFIPVVDTFAQFGTTKGALPFIMSSLSEAPMIAVFSHIGFQDAADGASHQSLTYMAMLNAIPNVKTIALSCSSEAEALVYEAVSEFQAAKEKGETPMSYVFFLGRENFPQYYQESASYKIDKLSFVRKAKDSSKKVCLIPVGSLVPQAIKAAETLATQDIECSIVHPATLNKVSAELIKEIEACGSKAIVIEEHQALGGYHSVLSSELTSSGSTATVKSLAVQAKFGQSAYTANELYKMHGLDSTAIEKAALSFFN